MAGSDPYASPTKVGPMSKAAIDKLMNDAEVVAPSGIRPLNRSVSGITMLSRKEPTTIPAPAMDAVPSLGDDDGQLEPTLVHAQPLSQTARTGQASGQATSVVARTEGAFASVLDAFEASLAPSIPATLPPPRMLYLSQPFAGPSPITARMIAESVAPPMQPPMQQLLPAQGDDVALMRRERLVSVAIGATAFLATSSAALWWLFG